VITARQIKDLILQSHTSLRSFCREHGLVYTTFMSMLDNGLEKAKFQHIHGLSRALGLTLEAFTDDQTLQEQISIQAAVALMCDPLLHNPRIQRLLQNCRGLDEIHLELMAGIAETVVRSYERKSS
jgi:hypothetical protein